MKGSLPGLTHNFSAVGSFSHYQMRALSVCLLYVDPSGLMQINEWINMLLISYYREKLRVEFDPSVWSRVSALDVVAKQFRSAVIRRSIPLHENKVVATVDNFRSARNAWSLCSITEHTRIDWCYLTWTLLATSMHCDRKSYGWCGIWEWTYNVRSKTDVRI